MDYQDNQQNDQNSFYDTEYRSYRDTVHSEKKKKKNLTWLFVLIGVLATVFVITLVLVGSYTLNNLITSRIGQIGNDSTSVLPDSGKSDADVPDDSKGEPNYNAAEIESATVRKEAADYSGAVVLDVSAVVENVMPTVVAITDTVQYKRLQSYDFYSRFFGYDGNDSYESVFSGSGVILGSNETELLIVTNNHVADASSSSSSSGYSYTSKGLTIEFVDGSTAPAVIKGTDPNSDLAVVAVKLSDISAETLSAIRTAVIGSSDDLKVGAGVIAIGNAGGYGQSVTTGIISAKDREVTIDDITMTLLQTDAAINPGNSGGGLFNANGELIGINNAKSVSTEIEGMGFAIPISYAESIIKRLMTRETIAEEDRGYLGVTVTTIPDSYISNNGYPAGASITEVAENSPAERAGLQIYDIITAVNDESIRSNEQLVSVVNSYRAGTTVVVTYRRIRGRNWEEYKTNVTLARRAELAENQGEQAEETGAANDGGLDIRDLIPDWPW